MLVAIAALATMTSAPATVYIMRHCVRATFYPDLLYADYQVCPPKNFGAFVECAAMRCVLAPCPTQYLANYSDGGALPDWGVAPSLCTPRGRRIIQGQGRSLKKEFLERTGGDLSRLKVVFDAGAKRDATTTEDFLSGLGAPANLSVGDASVFDPPPTWCPKVSAADKAAAVRVQLSRVRQPERYVERVAELQRVLGRGVAPPMTAIPDVISDAGYWLGGSFVASSWIEAMLLQYGAGIPVGYGRVNASYLYSLLELHVYYRAVADRGFAIEQRGESNLAAHMLRDLDLGAGDGGGVSLYVGHDTNLDGIAVMFDLAWPQAPPYPANTSTPGGLIRLTRTTEGDVSAAFLYTTFETDDGLLHEAPIVWPGKRTHIKYDELSAMVAKRILPACAPRPTPPPMVEEI